jgi:hypothetical protein
VASEHPLKQSALELPHDCPICPEIYPQQLNTTVFLAYAPGLPGKPNPQQHIWADEPPAPQISIMAVPD